MLYSLGFAEQTKRKQIHVDRNSEFDRRTGWTAEESYFETR
jgi:hypothetical protein